MVRIKVNLPSNCNGAFWNDGSLYFDLNPIAVSIPYYELDKSSFFPEKCVPCWYRYTNKCRGGLTVYEEGNCLENLGGLHFDRQLKFVETTLLPHLFCFDGSNVFFFAVDETNEEYTPYTIGNVKLTDGEICLGYNNLSYGLKETYETWFRAIRNGDYTANFVKGNKIYNPSTYEQIKDWSFDKIYTTDSVIEWKEVYGDDYNMQPINNLSILINNSTPLDFTQHEYYIAYKESVNSFEFSYGNLYLEEV